MASKIGWVIFNIVYLLGLENSVADAVSKQPGEAGWYDVDDLGDSGSKLYTLQDPVVFAAVKS